MKRLLASPHWLLLLMGLCAILIQRLASSTSPGADLLVFGCVALLIAGLDAIGRLSTRAVQLVVAAAVAVPWLFDAASLWGMGSPLQLSGVKLGLARFTDVIAASRAELGTVTTYLYLAAPLLVVALSLVLGRVWQVPRSTIRPWKRLVMPVVAIAVGTSFLVGGGRPLAASLLDNVHLRLANQSLDTQSETALPDVGYVHNADPTPPEGGLSGDRPNVLVVVLESTGFDAILPREGRVGMPTLLAMADNALVANRMRTTIPHTSKALVSILCGVYPARNTVIIESAENYPLTCLPHLLSPAGYHSAFLQSADGTFERRPALVTYMGFDEYFALQDRPGEMEEIGYLAGAELPMADQLESWLNTIEGPFFATVLTSLTHHPYLAAPSSTPNAAAINENPDPEARHAALIGASDRLLRALLDQLEEADRLDNTIFIVLGDHGENFSEYWPRQHDGVWAENVLHVPFVMSGPGIPSGQVIDVPTSVLDVMPTLGELLEFEVPSGAEGVSLLSSVPVDRTLFSASWMQDYWTSASRGRFKLVLSVGTGDLALFDLATRPVDRVSLAGVAELQLIQTSLHEELTLWQSRGFVDVETANFAAREYFNGRWGCEGENCWWTATGLGISRD